MAQEHGNNAIDIEKMYRDNSLIAATHNAFGQIPLDDKYLPVMSAYIKGYAAEYAEKILMNLSVDLSSKGQISIYEAINENRKNLSDAMTEYSSYTNPWNREN